MRTQQLNIDRETDSDAFSLVEVVVALAIAALGFITILGVLPQGLEMAQQSAKLSTHSRIALQLTGEMQAASWDDITWTGYGPKRFYTDQGVEISPQDISSADNALALSYVASIYVPSKALDYALPSAGSKVAGTKFESYMRRIRVDIVSSATPDVDFNKVSSRRITSLPAVLAKTSN